MSFSVEIPTASEFAANPTILCRIPQGQSLFGIHPYDQFLVEAYFDYSGGQPIQIGNGYTYVTDASESVPYASLAANASTYSAAFSTLTPTGTSHVVKPGDVGWLSPDFDSYAWGVLYDPSYSDYPQMAAIVRSWLAKQSTVAEYASALTSSDGMAPGLFGIVKSADPAIYAVQLEMADAFAAWFLAYTSA